MPRPVRTSFTSFPCSLRKDSILLFISGRLTLILFRWASRSSILRSISRLRKSTLTDDSTSWSSLKPARINRSRNSARVIGSPFTVATTLTSGETPASSPAGLPVSFLPHEKNNSPSKSTGAVYFLKWDIFMVKIKLFFLCRDRRALHLEAVLHGRLRERVGKRVQRLIVYRDLRFCFQSLRIREVDLSLLFVEEPGFELRLGRFKA